MKNKINWPEDKFYKYWAMDKNGRAFFYGKEPEIIDDEWMGGWEPEEHISFKNTDNLNWRESLVCRDDVEKLSFQDRVQPWLMECFGEMIAGDKEERNHRFLEEALELVQSCGCTQSEAHQLVDYVYGRDKGEPYQEVGGVMVTLAALCLANDLDMHENAETELSRIWTKVVEIREKQAAKPKHSPLPQRNDGGA